MYLNDYNTITKPIYGKVRKRGGNDSVTEADGGMELGLGLAGRCPVCTNPVTWETYSIRIEALTPCIRHHIERNISTLVAWASRDRTCSRCGVMSGLGNDIQETLLGDLRRDITFDRVVGWFAHAAIPVRDEEPRVVPL